jgi:hypothetical protein
MISDRDVYAAAKRVIAKREKAAKSYAEARAQSLLEMGDLNGQAAWKRIAKAIAVLEANRAPKGYPNA